MSRSKLDITPDAAFNKEDESYKEKRKLSVAADRKFKRFETFRSRSNARLDTKDKNNISLGEPFNKKPKFLLPSSTSNAISQSAILSPEKAEMSPVNAYY